ncbi:MAG: nucleotidyltransferase domain-containing protein [Bacillota bacterium]
MSLLKKLFFDAKEKRRLALLLAKEERLNQKKRAGFARQRAKEIARWLKDCHQVKAVYLFGSLARDKFCRWSDIDLYVVGLPRKARCRGVIAEAENKAAPFKIDIVIEEEAPDHIKKAALEEGELLS